MVKLTVKEIFRLGFAYGSFSAGEIDQGIHIVLPVTDESGAKENDIFEPLCEEYFNKIPKDVELVGLVYMGAIAAFVVDNQLDLTSEVGTYIELYRRIAH